MAFKFDNKAYLIASARLGQHGRKIDGLIAKSDTVRTEWTSQCLAGLREEKLTVDGIREQLMMDRHLAMPKAERDAMSVDEVTNFKEFVGQTINGWFHGMVRIHSAGDDAVKRVVDNGEASTTVMRSLKAVQPQAAKKGGANPKAAAKLPSLAESTAALNSYITAALADNSKALALAGNAELATLIGNLAKLSTKVDAIAKAGQKKAA